MAPKFLIPRVLNFFFFNKKFKSAFNLSITNYKFVNFCNFKFEINGAIFSYLIDAALSSLLTSDQRRMHGGKRITCG